MSEFKFEVDADRLRDKLKAQRNKEADDAAIASAFGEQMFARVQELEAENASLKDRIAMHESEATARTQDTGD